jgi:hypothetical protein
MWRCDLWLTGFPLNGTLNSPKGGFIHQAHCNRRAARVLFENFGPQRRCGPEKALTRFCFSGIIYLRQL